MDIFYKNQFEVQDILGELRENAKNVFLALQKFLFTKNSKGV